MDRQTLMGQTLMHDGGGSAAAAAGAAGAGDAGDDGGR